MSCTGVGGILGISGPTTRPVLLIEGRPLTREVFVAKVREALSEAGFDPLKFAGHSFRIGAASTAARRGVEDSLIKTLGRWQSSAYLLYVRIPQEHLAWLSTILADKQCKVYFCILATRSIYGYIGP